MPAQVSPAQTRTSLSMRDCTLTDLGMLVSNRHEQAAFSKLGDHGHLERPRRPKWQDSNWCGGLLQINNYF